MTTRTETSETALTTIARGTIPTLTLVGRTTDIVASMPGACAALATVAAPTPVGIQLKAPPTHTATVAAGTTTTPASAETSMIGTSMHDPCVVLATAVVQSSSNHRVHFLL